MNSLQRLALQAVIIDRRRHENNVEEFRFKSLLAANFPNHAKKFLGIDDEEEFDYEYEEFDEEDEVPERMTHSDISDALASIKSLGYYTEM